MPEVIHKYPLHPRSGVASAEMPTRRKILSLQVQRGSPCVWAWVDTESPLEAVRFACVPTGGEVPENAGPYVGTVMLYVGGPLVLHVFGGN